MPTWIKAGRILTPTNTLDEAVVIVDGGQIAAIEPRGALAGSPPGVEVIDARAYWVIPGLIDVHVHGGAGSDTMDATPEAFEAVARFCLLHGVTSFLPTTITSSPEAIRQAIENVAACGPVPGGARSLGLHLEGPYLGHANRGAQPARWLRPPDPAEYMPWFDSGHVRLMTLAPELPGAQDCIRAGRARGVRFSAGHTEARYADMVAAAGAGLDQATHTFNGMLGVHHREPGTAGAVLVDDRIYAEVIADGVHVHPAILQLIVRAKGTARTILVTDAMRAAGMPDGVYDLGGQETTVSGGIARTAVGGLAGSTLTLNRAVRNAAEFTGLPLGQALAMATTTPAASLGLAGRKGTLQPGADADLVIVDAELNVAAAMVAGRLTRYSL